MTNEAIAARREYQRKYRETHREQLNAARRSWASRNKDKIIQYKETYWQRKADETEGERS